MDKRLRILAYFCLLSIIVSTFSCKKAVDQAIEKAAYEIITNGRWEIVKFEVGTTSLLTEYDPFEFQFYKGGVVTAFLPGSPDVNGTWLGKEDVFAIVASFTGVENPLKRLNGTWSITGATTTTVRGTRTEGSDVYTLWLKKI